MSVEILSRIQFALTISFHFLFPPMTIGLGLALVVMQTLRVWTGKPMYTELARFWTGVFGLIFAIGVATGIPMEFQFGTNWSRYARFVGDIFGSPLAIEGIYAFFLESGFLALLLFGWHRIGPKMHLFATAMVALGAHFSAIWILVANSWMQTPAGYHLARSVKVTADGVRHAMTDDLGGAAYAVQEIPLPAGYVVQPDDLGFVRAVVDNFHEAILNPSTLQRLAHTVLACWMTGAFLVAAVGARWLLRRRHLDYARASVKIGLGIALVACLLQMLAGDSTARGVARHQPTKLAALEGLAQTRKDAPLGLFGYVAWKRDAQGNIVGVEDRAVRLPGLLSVLVSGNFLHPAEATQTVVPGLEGLPPDDFLRQRHPGATDEELAALRPTYWPNVPVLFQTYHLMIALGVALTALALLAAALWKTGRLFDPGSRLARLVLVVLVLAPLLCQVAIQCGWFSAEMGRQPWIVYGVLKTNEAASAVVKAPQVMMSIVWFSLIYLMLGTLFVALFARKVRRGPVPLAEGPPLEEKSLPVIVRVGRQMEEVP